MSLKTVLIGCGSLLILPLGGCVTSGADKPVVQNVVVQKAVSKPAPEYIIQRAAIRTPGAERFWRAPPPVTQVRQRSNTRPAAVNHAAQYRQQQARAAVIHKQNAIRAQYHARYQARQQAEEKRRQQLAASKKRLAPPPRQHQVAASTKQEVIPASKQLTRKAAPVVIAQQRQRQHQQQRPRPEARQPVQQQPARRGAQRTGGQGKETYLARWEQQQAARRLEAKKAEQRVERVIHNAKQQIGSKYVWGGASPKTGFDCSGLVQHAIKKGANVTVPRTAAEQYRVAHKVPESQADRGDLVFFKTRGNTVSHVGIYLGNGKFVHAPRTGRRITTSNLSGYWKQRFVGFGRIPGACRVPV